MPDLVTHLCTALLPQALTGWRHTGPFAIGAALPDLTSRLPGLFVTAVARLGVPVPEWLPGTFGFGHTPAGSLLWAALASYPFPEAQRPRVFAAIAGGCLLHFATDVLQDHGPAGGYPLLWPVSGWTFELAWVPPDASVVAAPILAALTAGAWFWRRRVDARGRAR